MLPRNLARSEEVFHQAAMVPPSFGVRKIAHLVALASNVHTFVHKGPLAERAWRCRHYVVVYAEDAPLIPRLAQAIRATSYQVHAELVLVFRDLAAYHVARRRPGYFVAGEIHIGGLIEGARKGRPRALALHLGG